MRPRLAPIAGTALALLATLAPLVAPAAAQSLNPDISVIGDVRAFVIDDPADPKQGELQLDLESAELAIQGYLNPFARADLFVGWHDGEFELEELYATILRGLPLDTVLRAGKYRVDFGKLNLLHPHAYSFLDTPLVHRQFLGEEGLADIGLNLNWQVPIGDASLTISGNLLKGDWVEPDEHAAEDASTSLPTWLDPGPVRALQDEPDGAAEIETALGTSERIALFVPTGEWAGIEVGVNALQGTLDERTDRGVDLLGADLKYRWAPDRYRSLTVQGEWIRSERDVLHDDDPEGNGPESSTWRATASSPSSTGASASAGTSARSSNGPGWPRRPTSPSSAPACSPGSR